MNNSSMNGISFDSSQITPVPAQLQNLQTEENEKEKQIIDIFEVAFEALAGNETVKTQAELLKVPDAVVNSNGFKGTRSSRMVASSGSTSGNQQPPSAASRLKSESQTNQQTFYQDDQKVIKPNSNLKKSSDSAAIDKLLYKFMATNKDHQKELDFVKNINLKPDDIRETRRQQMLEHPNRSILDDIYRHKALKPRDNSQDLSLLHKKVVNEVAGFPKQLRHIKPTVDTSQSYDHSGIQRPKHQYTSSIQRINRESYQMVQKLNNRSALQALQIANHQQGQHTQSQFVGQSPNDKLNKILSITPHSLKSVQKSIEFQKQRNQNERRRQELQELQQEAAYLTEVPSIQTFNEKQKSKSKTFKSQTSKKGAGSPLFNLQDDRDHPSDSSPTQTNSSDDSEGSYDEESYAYGMSKRKLLKFKKKFQLDLNNTLKTPPPLNYIEATKGAEGYKHDSYLYRETLIKDEDFMQIKQVVEDRKAIQEEIKKGIDFSDAIEIGYHPDIKDIERQQDQEEDQRNFFKIQDTGFISDLLASGQNLEDHIDARIRDHHLKRVVASETHQKDIYAPYRHMAVNSFGQKLLEGMIHQNVSEDRYSKEVLNGMGQQERQQAQEKQRKASALKRTGTVENNIPLQKRKSEFTTPKSKTFQKNQSMLLSDDKLNGLTGFQDHLLDGPSPRKHSQTVHKRNLQLKKHKGLKIILKLAEQAKQVLAYNDIIEDSKAHKNEDLFYQHGQNRRFYKTVKQLEAIAGDNEDNSHNQHSYSDAQGHHINFSESALLKFYAQCTNSNNIPFPIFARGIQGNNLSIVGQYISEGVANGLAAFLEDRQHLYSKSEKYHIKQLNLDENGLRDESTAKILASIGKYDNLKSINLSNNELGPLMVKEIAKILDSPYIKNFQELSFTSCKTTKAVLGQFLSSFEDNLQSLKKLKLSSLPFNSDQTLTTTLCTLTLPANQNLQTLTLSRLGLVPSHLAMIMATVKVNCQSLKNLNFSDNTLAVDVQNASSLEFCQHLAEFIEQNSLQYLNLNNMGLRNRIQKLLGVINTSATLLSVHISNNDFDNDVLREVISAFGVMTSEQMKDEYFKTSLLEQPILDKYEDTQEDDDDKKQSLMRKLNFVPLYQEQNIKNFEQASAQIVNMEVTREVYDQQRLQNSKKNQGFGHTPNITQQPLIFTRKLGHAEFIFNNLNPKQTQKTLSTSQNPQKWILLKKEDDCWVSNNWKYCVIFIDLSEIEESFEEITNQNHIDQLIEQYKIEKNFFSPWFQSEDLKNAPQIMGSVTHYTAYQMLSIARFINRLDPQSSGKKQPLNLKKQKTSLQKLESDIKRIIQQEQPNMVAKDWREKVIEHLPYPKKDCLLINLPEKLDHKRTSNMTADEINDKYDDRKGNVFVYADYMKAGRQQIVIYNKLTDTFWAKNIVIDVREVDPLIVY